MPTKILHITTLALSLALAGAAAAQTATGVAPHQTGGSSAGTDGADTGGAASSTTLGTTDPGAGAGAPLPSSDATPTDPQKCPAITNATPGSNADKTGKPCP